MHPYMRSRSKRKRAMPTCRPHNTLAHSVIFAGVPEDNKKCTNLQAGWTPEYRDQSSEAERSVSSGWGEDPPVANKAQGRDDQFKLAHAFHRQERAHPTTAVRVLLGLGPPSPPSDPPVTPRHPLPVPALCSLASRLPPLWSCICTVQNF